MPALAVPTDQIVITASRAPETEERTAASVTVIDGAQIERLGEPLAPALLKLTPSAAVSTSGPLGSLTDVRIRGSEANHTLLFIDGIRANDPAAGDAPRFELLNTDLISRIEVVRGPQSALWGSDAIGGVIAVNGIDDLPGYAASAEAGSFGFARASASGAAQSGKVRIAGGLGWQRSSGIDSFGAPGGDKDGYRNVSARARSTFTLSDNAQLGVSGFLLTGRTEFDGYSPITFERTDTLDNTRNRLAAGRVWADFGDAASGWSGQLGASLLGSSNRNYLDRDPLNRTKGDRRLFDGQIRRSFATGAVRHDIVAAAEAERETFHARGLVSGFSTDQDRARERQAITVEWRATVPGVTADAALRRDIFSRFKDATSFRASLLTEIGGGFSLAGSYAQGIAQPTFFDLYGTFPNLFVGNPDLKPEVSRGLEASLRFRRAGIDAALTAYRQRLHDEIVDVFDFATFRSTTENSSGVSRRSGLEAELGWQIASAVRVAANYAYLDATQPESVTGKQVRERRRPKHSGSVTVDGSFGRWSYGASLAYAGSHLDTLEVYPYGVVRVKPYWIGNARVAYSVRPGVELFARGSNLFNDKYEEVAGYKTEGRGAFIGLRLSGGR